MKKLSIATTCFLCLLVSVTFAQRKQDSSAVEDQPKRVKAESKLALIEKETIFGYHHNNYKQHAKAKKASKWFRVRGHVNRSAKVTNYKMPFTEQKEVEKTTVKESTSPKRSRNYKRPYSNN